MKPFIYLLLIAFLNPVYGQYQINKKKLIPKTSFETIGPDYSFPDRQYQNQSSNSAKAMPFAFGVEIGQTSYDFQGNGTMSRRLTVDPNGNIMAVWTDDQPGAGGGPLRKIGFNYFLLIFLTKK